MDGPRWRWLEAGVDRDRRDWAAALERCDHDVHQLPDYVELEARRVDGVATALLLEGPNGLALVPLILRRLPPALGLAGVDAISPYGYPAPVFSRDLSAWDLSALVEAMLEALHQRGVVTAFVRLHPLLAAPLDDYRRHGQVIEHGPTVWIDLEADEQTQWAEHRPTHRNLIRRAQREGLRVRFDDRWADLDGFFAVYAQTMVRLGASWADLGRDYLAGLAAALGERAFLGLVECDDQIIAGGVFTRCGGIVQYHLSGTADAWQHASPSRLLLDQVRRRCVELGDRRLHLGGGVGAREDALYRFKRGFSRQRGRFHSWRVIADEAVHAELVRRWRALAEDDRDQTDEFFPRYRAPIDSGGMVATMDVQVRA